MTCGAEKADACFLSCREVSTSPHAPIDVSDSGLEASGAAEEDAEAICEVVAKETKREADGLSNVGVDLASCFLISEQGLSFALEINARVYLRRCVPSSWGRKSVSEP